MKMGLEIHQRLDSGKLFCACPSIPGAGEPLLVQRELHPVMSELGRMDATALDEAGRGTRFAYLYYPNSCCLVELDEEPPHPMNAHALGIALEISSALKSETVDEINVMRKIVIDGSNTSGFQRTAVISLGGKVECAGGDVRITTIAIEEESAGIVEKAAGLATYSLDRLGIPLIEISTEPDIKTPEHLKECAEKIGMILRASGKVQRGIGTIRQDVNISVDGGARVEIKGAQDLKMLPQMAKIEAARQEKLIEISKKLHGRGAYGARHSGPADLTRLFAKTGAKMLKAGLEGGQNVFGISLREHAGILGTEIAPGKRYGTELSDYAKTAGVKGIIHSDEDMGKYGITQEEIESCRSALSSHKDDAIVLVLAHEKTALNALARVLSRAAMDFVPMETRRANPDGTSSYMRPIAGSSRMYPETDIPPIRITKNMLKIAGSAQTMEDKGAHLESLLGKDMALRMLKSRNLGLFERLVKEGADAQTAAFTLEDTLTMLRREKIEPDAEIVVSLFSEYNKGTFVRAAIPDMLRLMAKGVSAHDALESGKLRKIGGAELAKIVAECKGDMKAVMAKYRLNVDSREVAEAIRKNGK
jgi:glutamyl-tRNA(Gln) amidotransferase subunit E